MPIAFDADSNIFKLDTAHSSYLFRIDADGRLGQLHFGGRISDLAGAAYLQPTSGIAFSPVIKGARNGSPAHSLQEFSTHGACDFRLPSAIVRTLDGTHTTDPRYVSHTLSGGKPALAGLPATFVNALHEADTLAITLRDEYSGCEFILSYSVFTDCDVIARSVMVRNASNHALRLERLMSACLDLPERDYDLIQTSGAWARERQIFRTPLRPGTQTVDSARGSSSHQHTPAFAIASRQANEDHGDVYGLSLVYSGSFTCDVELDQIGNVRACAGINPIDFEWLLEPGECFQAPEALLTYSAQGLGGMSRQFHDVLRKHLISPRWRDQKRPILINNWEATYFNFTAEKLIAIARQARALGVEMLVLDDGWFGHRDDDRSSLGDWFVNRTKLGDFNKLVRDIKALGMQFGLWFEPEMISENSDLYRSHPDWVLTIPGRTPSLGRNQMLLDMANPVIIDHLFNTISTIIRDAGIDYIKWDMNRQPAEISSPTLPPERQLEVGHRFVLGVYELHRRLLRAFPDLLIEGCSGGGGRFDAGMLYYVPQIWTSDDSDAIERIRIQSGTSLFYPASAMGAHVSAVPNHQTHRTTSLETRGYVALSGTFGYEMDLNTLSTDECEVVRKQTALYHRINPIVAQGDFYRLNDPFHDQLHAEWSFVSKDRREALLFYVVTRYLPPKMRRSIRLRGLDPHKQYRVEGSDRIITGDTLMNAGMVMPELNRDGASVFMHFVCVDRT